LLQYWLIAVALLVATVVEVLLADYLKEIGMGGGVVAGSMLAIALIKALLVILYYMHLRYERAILWVIFSIPFGLVSLLALAMFSNP
jgi:caa(3)-type oxidase subunit IV